MLLIMQILLCIRSEAIIVIRQGKSSEEDGRHIKRNIEYVRESRLFPGIGHRAAHSYRLKRLRNNRTMLVTMF